jgi:hypothetical protein
MSISRREFLERAVALATLPAVIPPVAHGQQPALPDATLQAFADTILPGRKAARTDLGEEIHPQAIAGVDLEPGAVEADALLLYHHPLVGFDTLQPAFLADLEARSLRFGAPFLSLGWDQRVEVVKGGLDFSNPDRAIWEAAAAVPFTAFCAAALIPEQTAEKASGYRVMGLPGKADGYADFSYRRRLSRERTKRGSLR